MSTRDKLIKARLGMLALAEELQNISLACKRAGVSRSHFYEIKDAFENYGADGLAPRPRRKPRMPNHTPPELEQQILEMTERYPTASYVRIAQHLRLIGVGVSPSAVRYVWQRHSLSLRNQRLLWLERKVAVAGGVLTEPAPPLTAWARPADGPGAAYRPIWIATSSFTIGSGRTKSIGRRGAHPIRLSWTAWPRYPERR